MRGRIEAKDIMISALRKKHEKTLSELDEQIYNEAMLGKRELRTSLSPEVAKEVEPVLASLGFILDLSTSYHSDGTSLIEDCDVTIRWY